MFLRPSARSASAERLQVARVGDSAHAAGDVQLPHAPHSASLPRAAPVTPSLARRRSTDQSEPAAPLVSLRTHTLTLHTARASHFEGGALWRMHLSVMYIIEHASFEKINNDTIDCYSSRGMNYCTFFLMQYVTLQHKSSLKQHGYFAAIAKNTLYESKLYIFILCQKSLGY